jgi:GT2 family glycosyltransferase
MPPVLSVIIPTRNRQETLRRTIQAWICHECRVPFELVVVDDGSEDGTSEYLAAEAAHEARLRVSRQPHAGPAQARNRAIAAAQGTYLLLIGDDVRPGEGFLDGHVAAHEGPRPPRFVLGCIEWDPERPVTPVMRHVTGFGGQQFRFAYLRNGQRLGFKYFYSSNLSLRRDALGALAEPFDPAFGGAALEDADLGYRLMGRERHIEYRAGLVAWHDHPYDLAGFARRQHLVGRSTAILFAKHPGIAQEFGGQEVMAAIETATSPGTGEDGVMSPGEVADAEAQLLASLASVEHLSHAWQERIYMGLFWYFQAKGMAETQVPAPAVAPVLGVLMGRTMVCPLRSALRDPTCGLPSDTRATLDRLAVRLTSASRGGRLPGCVRWWFSIRARELLYEIRARR